MPTNPIDALKKLRPGAPSFYADDPSTSYGDEVGTNDHAITSALTKGAASHRSPYAGANREDLFSLQDARRSELEGRVAADPGDARGGRELSRLLGVMKADPDTGEQAQKDSRDWEVANKQALAQGFGNQDTNPVTRMHEAGRQDALTKLMIPGMASVAVEREKGKNALALDKQNFDLLTNGGDGSGTHTPSPAPGGNPSTPDPPNATQSWKDFIMGTGKQPYNSLKDLGEAASNRVKYMVMATPGSDYTQQASFGNLSQLQAMFPGSRGVQALMGKLSEHQSNIGKETPGNSYLRLAGMRKMLDETEAEINSMPKVRMGPSGKLESAVTPQMILRAQLAVKDTRMKNEEAMAGMARQYPGIERILQNHGGEASTGAMSPSHGPAPTQGSSRFERIPESPNGGRR